MPTHWLAHLVELLMAPLSYHCRQTDVKSGAINKVGYSLVCCGGEKVSLGRRAEIATISLHTKHPVLFH